MLCYTWYSISDYYIKWVLSPSALKWTPIKQSKPEIMFVMLSIAIRVYRFDAMLYIGSLDVYQAMFWKYIRSICYSWYSRSRYPIISEVYYSIVCYTIIGSLDALSRGSSRQPTRELSASLLMLLVLYIYIYNLLVIICY